MFRNAMPRYEELSAEAMATLDKGWRRLFTDAAADVPGGGNCDAVRAELEEYVVRRRAELGD